MDLLYFVIPFASALAFPFAIAGAVIMVRRRRRRHDDARTISADARLAALEALVLDLSDGITHLRAQVASTAARDRPSLERSDRSTS